MQNTLKSGTADYVDSSLKSKEDNLFWIFPNSIAHYQLGQKCKQLEDIKDAMSDDPDSYAREICILFDKEFSPNMCDKGVKLKEIADGLSEILNQYVERKLCYDKNMEELDNKLQEYWVRNRIKSVPLSLKKEKKNPRHAEHVNAFIETFKLPFSLSDKLNKAYVLSRIEI